MTTAATYDHLRRLHPAAVAQWAADQHPMLTADDRDALQRLHLERRIADAENLITALRAEIHRLSRSPRRCVTAFMLPAEIALRRALTDQASLRADLDRLLLLSEAADV